MSNDHKGIQIEPDTILKIAESSELTSSKDMTDESLLLHKVIGQPRAIQAVIDCAKSGRNLLLIGLPGTGKSMLGKALAEVLPKKNLVDVIAKHNMMDPSHPKIELLEQGSSDDVIQAENELVEHIIKNYNYLTIFGMAIILALGLTFALLGQDINFVDVMFALLLIITWVMYRQRNAINYLEKTSSVLITHPTDEVPFIDASGSSHHILLGDIRHDPYQSGGLETPAHHLIVPGLVHKANGGILYIDEIGTLDPTSQFYLLTIMQDGKLPIEGRSEGSSGSVIKTEPVPCDFTLVAAGNYETVQLLHPALRSRIQGFGMEILMEKDMAIESIESSYNIMRQLVSQELEQSISVTESGLKALINLSQILSQRDGYLSLQFRTLGGVLRAAYDLVSFDKKIEITDYDLLQAFARQTPVEQQMQLQQLIRDIEYSKSIWSDNLIWLKNTASESLSYVTIEYISITEDEVLTEESKVLTHIYSRLNQLDVKYDELYAEFNAEHLPMYLTKLPAALVFGSIRPGSLDSDTIILGTLSREFKANPMDNIMIEVYNALNTGFKQIIVVSSVDHRKETLLVFDTSVIVVRDFLDFLRQPETYLHGDAQ